MKSGPGRFFPLWTGTGPFRVSTAWLCVSHSLSCGKTLIWNSDLENTRCHGWVTLGCNGKSTLIFNVLLLMVFKAWRILARTCCRLSRTICVRFVLMHRETSWVVRLTLELQTKWRLVCAEALQSQLWSWCSQCAPRCSLANTSGVHQECFLVPQLSAGVKLVRVKLIPMVASHVLTRYGQVWLFNVFSFLNSLQFPEFEKSNCWSLLPDVLHSLPTW